MSMRSVVYNDSIHESIHGVEVSFSVGYTPLYTMHGIVQTFR